MSTLRAAAERALAAIESLHDFASTVGPSSSYWDEFWPEHETAVDALRAALAAEQPQSEAEFDGLAWARKFAEFDPPAPAEQPQPARIDPMQNPLRPTLAKLGPAGEHPAEEVLRRLACWLGVGGYNAPTVDADLFHRKIVDGIQSMLAKRAAPAEQPQPVAICASEIAKIIRHARAGNQRGVESYALLLCDKLDASSPEIARYLRRVIAGDDGELVHPAAPPPSAPSGWRMVPVEPTKQMQAAGLKAHAKGRRSPSGPLLSPAVVYRAMLAQAPAADGFFKQPGWDHVFAAFVAGAREARANPDADETVFGRAADAYTKLIFSEVDPETHRRIGENDWPQPSAPSGWIACDERMPEAGVEVLVWLAAPAFKGGSNVVMDTWDEQHEVPLPWSSATIPIGMGWDSGTDCEGITHWMPLPAAPGAAPPPAAPQPDFARGIDAAARLVEQRLADYDAEHGSTDPDTGTREYPGTGDEYACELAEIAEAIRALAPPPAAAPTDAMVEAAVAAWDAAVDAYDGQHPMGGSWTECRARAVRAAIDAALAAAREAR